MGKKTIFWVLSIFLSISTMPVYIWGQSYPTREIEFLAAFAPGSGNDAFSRLTAKFSEKYVGKPIVVVNKPGGGGMKGYAMVANAKPDGYTIGLLGSGIVAQNYLIKNVPYRYQKSFQIISQVDYSPMGLSVKKGGPHDKSLTELIQKAKANPESIKVGIGGSWTTQDFTRAIFEEQTKIKFIKVPFPGGEGGIPALLGGHVDLEIGPATHWAHLYKAGKINVLAVATEQRYPHFPEIPTFREMGADVVFATVHYVAGPKGLSEKIVNFWADALRKAVAEKGFKDAAANMGAVAAWLGPEDALKSMVDLEKKYKLVIDKYGIKPD